MNETSEPPDTAGLARRLGLSRWAVSRALNGQPGVSAATRTRVRAAVAASGFEPNAHARGLRAAGPGMVGVALPTFRDPAWASLAGGLGEGILLRGLQPDWAFNVGESAGEVRAGGRYAARHVAAVLVLGSGGGDGGESQNPGPTDATAGTWRELGRRGVPVIFVEPGWSETPDGLTVVRTDFRAAAGLVAGHLHDRGHHRVGLRGFGPREQARAAALRGACETRGMVCVGAEAPPDFLRSGRLRSHRTPPPDRPPRGYPAGAEVPASDPKRVPPDAKTVNRRRGTAGSPTAVVTADDLIALRVLCEARATGRKVPEDCSVIGYGDEPAGALSAPALTTVDPQHSHLIARTLELLDEFLRDPGGVRAGCSWIAPLLRCRGSVASITAGGDA